MARSSEGKMLECPRKPKGVDANALGDWIGSAGKPKLPYTGPARCLARSRDELNELSSACREGRLTEVAAWIEAGRPLQLAPGDEARRARTTPLTIASETGQHDLVHLLLASGYRIDLESTSPLDLVLRSRRVDLLELLLEAGADPARVDPDAVFGTYCREIMERFQSLGIDLAGDGAMAAALAYETRNRPLYGFVKNHTDDPRIQREADLALGYALGRQNDKAVSMCLWAGANPRHSVPVMGGSVEPSDDWTMTAFERAVWEGVPRYLPKLGLDPEVDDVEKLYEMAYRVSDVEALVAIQPPRDWQAVTERMIERVMFSLEMGTEARWSARYDLERVFDLGGHLRSVPDLAVRRLRKFLKEASRDEAARWVGMLQKHSEASAFLDLIGQPVFVDDYKSWGLTKQVVEDLAAGRGGSKAAGARARRVLKAESERPPSRRVPRNTVGHVKMTREELYELVWSEPILKAAEHFGLSDNGLRKICRQLEVPTPPRGYWAGGRRGKRRARLPKAKPGWPTEAWLPARSEATDPDPVRD